ncbi:MAG: tetraacyldisaccharide 4'-kinase [Gammaproteobacteria bacterium]
MTKSWSAWLVHSWYQKSRPAAVCLWPLAAAYSGIVRLRKFLYDNGLLTRHRVPAPVIIVGNMTVGGTGKTPLIIWLAQFLRQSGYRPGIISRGYGGRSQSWPQRVDKHSDPLRVGDEALLIASQTGCPMAVAPSRVDAANMLLKESDSDVILSDDGLQHYALKRDIEIVVIDGMRRLGNGLCLPAGPLREPANRLNEADLVIVNGSKTHADDYSMQLEGDTAVNLVTGETLSLQSFRQQPCHALAGIGNPDRFFKQLESAGLTCQAHAFADHHDFKPMDIEFGDGLPVLMTDKDAVKCLAFAGEQHWRVPVTAVPEPGFSERILNLLREKHGRQ